MGVGPDGRDDGGEVLRLGGDDLLVDVGHAAGRVDQSVAVRILADALQQEADGSARSWPCP